MKLTVKAVPFKHTSDVYGTGICHVSHTVSQSPAPYPLLRILRFKGFGDRDSIDVQQTILMLIDKSIDVVSLDLPVSNLASSEGKLMLQMFAAFAELEKSRIIERIKEGLERAKAEGKKLGRPIATDTLKRVQDAKARGLSQSKAALELGWSLTTIKRNWNIKEA